MTLNDLLRAVTNSTQTDARLHGLETRVAALEGFVAAFGALMVGEPPVGVEPVPQPPVVVPEPVPAVDPNDPSLFVMPTGDPANPATWDQWIEKAAQVTKHVSATPEQFGYWRSVRQGLVDRGIEVHNPSYAWQKLIGMQSEGNDKPQFGPYR